MKKLVMLGLVGLTAMAATSISRTSFADEQGEWQGRLFRFEFNCDFEHHDNGTVVPSPTNPTTPAPTDDPNHDRCTAHATVFANVRGDDMTTSSDVNAEWLNKLAVECNGRLIYADGALLNSGFRNVRILANNNSGLPEIVVPRKEHETFSSEWMEHKAFLRLFREFREGKCQVRATPVRAVGDDSAEQPVQN